jgi:hypothetical protein
MIEHTKGKTEVSSLTWLFGFGVSWFISWQVVKAIYELNSNSLGGSGLIAVGSVMAVIYFSMTSKASLNKYGRALLWFGVFIYGLLVVPVEIFSLFTNNMSNSGSSELSQVRQIKESAQNKISTLELEKIDIQNSNVSAGSKIFRKSEINAKIDKLDLRANQVIQTNQSKAFDDIGNRLGIDNVEPIYKTVMAALLVFVMPLINISRNGTWCGLTLLMYKMQSGFVSWLMKEKTTETKNDSEQDRETKGAEENKPKRKLKTMGDYEAVKTWVEEEFIAGGYIGAESLKKATGTTAPHQQKAIISELIKQGVIEKKGKAVKKYYRTDVKQSALNQMKSTAKLFNFVSSK